MPLAAEGMGSGTMHTVWRKRPRSAETSAGHSDDVAVKIVNRRELPGLDKEPQSVLSEVSLLAAAQHHPNIIGYHGLLTSEDTDEEDITCMSIIVDYCSMGSLLTAVIARPFSESRANSVIKGILSGLVHLHSMDIVHRDIKPANVMLTCDNRSVISDFSAAAHTSDLAEMQRRNGSPGYVAPEVILGLKYNTKVDCFGTGVVTYFVLSGQHPFPGSNIMSVMRRTLRCRLAFNHPEFKQISTRCKMFITSLTSKDAHERPDATAALDDCWFAFAKADEGS